MVHSNDKKLVLTLMRTPKSKTLIPHLVDLDLRPEMKQLQEQRKEKDSNLCWTIHKEKIGTISLKEDYVRHRNIEPNADP